MQADGSGGLAGDSSAPSSDLGSPLAYNPISPEPY